MANSAAQMCRDCLRCIEVYQDAGIIAFNLDNLVEILADKVTRTNIARNNNHFGKITPSPQHGVATLAVIRWNTDRMSSHGIERIDQTVDIGRCDAWHVPKRDDCPVTLIGQRG